MPRNVEIKARVDDFEALRARAEALSDTPVQIIEQLDTFYITPRGRLKLRVLAPDRCELIQYTRADDSSAKTSAYEIVRSDDPAAFSRILESALPIRGVVTKRRFLYLIGQTRVHLDEVEGLGTFMELEVVLTKGQTTQYGAAIAEELMAKLGIEEEDLISGAYIDLLEQ
ncbi:class IV adenylate cyclase [Candidatus Bipolaricaulota bacterium]|nr:class IV adenylate cyclase [Candidatus Bipolaricaulota bacterium]TFH10651.1 MAG: CYTH domain-containing protein [Candidatus Atribacteria bacterium]